MMPDLDCRIVEGGFDFQITFQCRANLCLREPHLKKQDGVYDAFAEKFAVACRPLDQVGIWG